MTDPDDIRPAADHMLVWERVDTGLVIVPNFTKARNADARSFDGLWRVLHLPSGNPLPASPACLACCRETAWRYSTSGLDWSQLRPADGLTHDQALRIHEAAQPAQACAGNHMCREAKPIPRTRRRAATAAAKA